MHPHSESRIRTRKWATVAVIALTALPCRASRQVSVAQLEKVLQADAAARKNAEDVVRQLAGMELTERLTNTDLERLATPFEGTAVAAALQLLSDQSQFRPPPASGIPATAPPDAATQQRLLAEARNYVRQTLTRLPDFMATETTRHYNDSPYAMKKNEWPMRTGLHLVDSSSREISIRDERESHLPSQGSALWQQQRGLISGGEFGATLAMILTDTDQGKVTWGHWETTGQGVEAVFDYAVPRGASHFAVISALERPSRWEMSAMSPGGGGVAGIGVRPGAGGGGASVDRTEAAYHGSLWIDPATGTILRITIEADLKGGALRRAAILVRYTPVAIGGSTFICPAQSLALSAAVANTEDVEQGAPTEWLNVTEYANYHRFGSSVRVVPAAPQ